MLSETWATNIRKIFRELIAFKFYLADQEIKDTQKRRFHFMANKGDETKVTNFREEPCIVFYYFVDNGITKDEFE